MTLEDKIIFVADTIEPNRTYKERSAIEAIAKKDLDIAIGYIQYFTISKLLSKENPFILSQLLVGIHLAHNK